MTPNNPDYEDAHKALKIVGDATNQVNKMMGQTKNFKELLALQERLDNFRLRIKPNQSLVKEGAVKIQTLHKGLQPKYMILLSDILITGEDFKKGYLPNLLETALLCQIFAFLVRYFKFGLLAYFFQPC